MDNYAANVDFIRALARSPIDRDDDDLHIIYAALRRLDIFHRLGDGPLRAVCRSARYERHAANEILYRKGHLSTCWYILLSGSVFVENQMYLPRSSFGKRSGNSNRRPNDCLVLEQSEMIVIDYPDVQHSNGPNGPMDGTQRNSRKGIQSMNLDHVVLSSSSGIKNGSIANSGHHPVFSRPVPPSPNNYHPHHTNTISSSSSSSTVSANSGVGSSATTPTSSLMRQRHFRDKTGQGSGGAHLESEQMREVETIVHRSEVYLGGTVDNHGHPNSRGQIPSPSGVHGHQVFQRTEGSTRSSTSSAYSGSTDQMTPSNSVAEDELAGLPEANVDSDEDDDESCPSADSFVELRDNVRDCLEKGPEERTEDDLLVLLDFMQHMPAFADLPMSVKRELCWKMVFAVVEKAGSSVMQDGEQLDSWCVIVNGEVEVILPDGGRMEYHLGDSFGVEPRPEGQFNQGQMRTLVDDCQFVLVTQEDYVAIMSKVADNLQKQMDAAGEIVSETEKRTIDHQEAYVIIKAKPTKLIDSLVEDSSGVDPYFVEDFLLMYRTFIDEPVMIFEKLVLWFAETSLREKVARLVLLWVNNHFNDFETNQEMMKMLENFEQALERENMHNHTSLLNIACSVKSKSRTVTYTRSNKDEILHFSVLGGHEKGYGIFVSKVEAQSKAEKVGLKRGDEILEVNGQNFQHIQHQRALDILRGATHLSITVKSNLLGFKEMLAAPDRSENQNSLDRKSLKNLGKSETQIKLSAPPRSGMTGTCQSQLRHNQSATVDSKMGLPPTPVSPGGRLYDPKAGKLGKLISKLKGANSLVLSESDEVCDEVSFDPDPKKSGVLLQGVNRLKPSRSNPDITEHSIHGIPGGMNQYYQPQKSAQPEHVLKIYRSDQSFKYLTVYKDTTALNVVQLALQEFGMAESTTSANWMLSQASVTPEGIIKSRCLPDQMMNLAEKISLDSRYYLKNKNKAEILIPDELAPEVMKAAEIQFLQLNAPVIAAQLTLQDFSVFSSIEPTEYVDNLFKRMSAYGWPKLEEFEELVNQEMWWVATEILTERSVIRRSKLVKKFIKIARHCRDCRNFNSMFAIMSGLEKPAVRRLHHTWDKVAGKYMKMFEDLQLLLDPSRNMSKYRQHLVNVSEMPPVVPLYPVIKKDLTFIHEGNPTWRDGMVNFEKLRMIAKEVRAVSKLGSAPYDLSSMFEGGGKLNDALIHMNTFMEGVSGNSVATMRKHNLQKSANNLPRKKVYENALMIRKVKSYLSNLKIISDESELDKLSMECEPQVGSGSVGKDLNVTKKRMPSPSPSSSSSLSNASDPHRKFHSRFGVESPQAVQKLYSLVDHARPVKLSEAARSQRHTGNRVAATLPPGMSGPVSGAPLGIPGTSPNPSPCPPRRSHRTNRIPSTGSSGGHGRSQSEGIGSAGPVDLTAENSCVTTLLTPGGRISSTGSVTSTDSAVSQYSVPSSLSISHAISCDSTDSGHASMDAHSCNGTSPPNQRRSYPPNVNNSSESSSARHSSHTQTQARVNPMVGAHMMGHRPNPAYFQQQRTQAGKTKAPPPPSASAAFVKAHGSGQFPHVRRTNSGPGQQSGDKKNPGNEQVSRV